MTFIFSLVFAIPTVIIAFVPVEFLPITPGLTAKEVILFLLSSFIQVRAAGINAQNVSEGMMGGMVWQKACGLSTFIKIKIQN